MKPTDYFEMRAGVLCYRDRQQREFKSTRSYRLWQRKGGAVVPDAGSQGVVQMASRYYSRADIVAALESGDAVATVPNPRGAGTRRREMVRENFK